MEQTSSSGPDQSNNPNAETQNPSAEPSATPESTERPMAVVFPNQTETIINGKVISTPVHGMPDTPSPDAGHVFNPQPNKKKRFSKKVLVPIVAVLLLLFGGGAAAYFGYYVPNKPENLWGKSMETMGKGYDKLAGYVKDYKSGAGSKMSGTFNITGDYAASGSLDSNSDGKNSEIKASVNASAVKVNLDALAIDSGSKYPDFYIKITGLNTVGELLGAFSPELSEKVNSLNGQWYVADHTLYEKFLSSSGQSEITKADIVEVINAASGPTKKYVFTSDETKMAFVIKQQIGKEKQDERNVYHYKIGVNKANLKAYNTEMCDSLSKTKLFKYISGYSSEAQALKDCKDTSDIDSIKDSDSKDVWVDTHTKLVHKVRIASENNNYFDVLQDYQGGDVLPFGMVFNEKESNNSVQASLNGKLNMKNNSLEISASYTATGSTKSSGKFTFNYTPISTPVKVQKPANAKNIKELLDALGYGEFYDSLENSSPSSYGSIQSKAKDTERKTDLNMLATQLEVYYVDNGAYPTLAQFNDPKWVAANMKGLDSEALKDPDGTTSKLVATPTAKAYAYQPAPAGCNTTSSLCATYTLTATLSDGTKYSKNSLN